jgi:hypothetical protein
LRNAIPNPDEAIQTAVVLPDENLLSPILYSIPPKSENQRNDGLCYVARIGCQSCESIADLQPMCALRVTAKLFFITDL